MDTYQTFLDQFHLFQQEQTRQKQRGLNNYNLLTTVLNKSDEVRLHSRMLHSFLDPNGKHYQDSLFLEKFLTTLNVEGFEFDCKNCSASTEFNNIDIYLTDGRSHIILENKIYAGDQKNQIKRYVEYVIANNNEVEEENILVLYLNLDGSDPSQLSLGDLKLENDKEYLTKGAKRVAHFKAIQYKNEIKSWLTASQYEVQNISNLNMAFQQYMDVVNMLNNEYKDKIMNSSKVLFENEYNYKAAMDISNQLPKARKESVIEFFDSVTSQLQGQLGLDWIVEVDGDLSRGQKFPFRIYKESWISVKNMHLIFGFEFVNHNFNDGLIGVVRMNGSVDIKNDVMPNFSEELNSLKIPAKNTTWWLHVESLPESSAHTDFVEFILFHKDAEEHFVEKAMTVINNFESGEVNGKSVGLISKINAYLGEKAAAS